MSRTMKAMQVDRPGGKLVLRSILMPEPGPGEVRLRVRACAVCRTDLHVVDGDLPPLRVPVTPGHEVVGEVEALGPEVSVFAIGDRVGVPWLGHVCGTCDYCRSGEENLCDAPGFTGYSRDGGFAEYIVADARFCFPIPPSYSDVEAAPLLCAGLIGHRALVKAGDARRLGIYGFGAAAHIVAQVAVHQGREVYAFTRAGDAESQEFARSLGASWAGPSDALPPVELDAALIFAPVGALVPLALGATRKGGTVVCAGIHMSDIPSFPYGILWGERRLLSVANLTRRDGVDFLSLAPQVPVHTTTTVYALEQANRALDDLRAGRLQGAAVVVP